MRESDEYNDLYSAGSSSLGIIKNVLESFDMAVFILSAPDFKAVDMNKKAISFLNQCCISIDENIASSVFKCICPIKKTKLINLARNILEHKSSKGSMELAFNVCNKKMIFDCTIMPISMNPEHKVTHIIVALLEKHDKTEQSYYVKEDSNSVNELFSYMVHELKTPLNVIVSAVQAIEKFCLDKSLPKARVYIEKISRNANKQIRLINGLLDISKAETGFIKANKKNLDIVTYTKTIIEFVHIFASEKKIKIRFNTLLTSKIAAIDEYKYERILLNLLSNAIKFSKEGKSIFVNLSRLKGYICIEVKDEGIGIPLEKQNRIFEPFYQINSKRHSSKEGTGIGLTLVMKLVEVLGGRIEIESEEGKGTSVKLYLQDELVTEDSAVQQDYNEEILKRNVSIELSDI